MALSVFHPPLSLPPGMSAFRRNALLDKMAEVLIAEYNYYGALHSAGGMTTAQYDEYDDSHDAACKAIKHA